MKADKAKKYTRELSGPPAPSITSYEADDEIPDEATEPTEDELLIEGTGWMSAEDRADLDKKIKKTAKSKGK